MLKGTLLAATVLVAAATAMATNPTLETAAVPAVDPSCQLVSSLDLGCAMRVTDNSGEGAGGMAPELAGLAGPAAAIDWTPLRPRRSTGLDFKDAATDPGSVLPATLERDTSHRLIPALFALGAMVVLLRRRPA